MLLSAVLAGVLIPCSLASSTAFDLSGAGLLWASTESDFPADAAVDMIRLSVVPARGFHDACGITPLWGSALTRSLCFVPNAAVRIGSDVHVWHGTQTMTVDETSDSVLPTLAPISACQRWRESPLGITDGLRPSPVGQSRALYRRPRRRRARTSNNRGATLWWVAVLMAAIGVSTGITTFAVWACVTVVMGVYMLVTDQHCEQPLCKVLSLNYWCACASMMWTFSPTVGAILGIIAVRCRGSLLLFPDQKGMGEKRGVGGAAADGM
jgi:hypothetical protein